MTPDEENQLAELIEKRLNESITDGEAVELESKLTASKAARRLFLDLTSQHANLRMLGDSLAVEKLVQHERPYSIRALAAAAAVVIGCFFWLRNTQPETVATLVSNEDAAWESTLPTAPGSKLEAGELELKAGVATIRFHSGVEVVLEAPAKLELQTPMRGKLLFGAAVIDVPEPAIGFILDTPGGYAVDHGTQFAVKVHPDTIESSFTVISGEISVHHPLTGKELRLKEDQVSTITEKGLELKHDSPLSRKTRRRLNSKRIRSGEFATTIVRNDQPHLVRPDMLMAKSQAQGIEFDRRSLFSFQVEKSDLEKAKYARLRFYVVPSGFGYAAHLPQTNTFAVYGVSNESAEEFPIDCKWDQAPAIETARKLGAFSIRRSKLKGVVWFRSDALLDFVKSDTTGKVTFILVRETHEIDRHGLVHAFAKDSHPEGSGPVLDLGFEAFQPGKRAATN